jgi:hypothetical protein
MNYRRILHGAKFWFWVALFVAYSAGAVGLVMIDTYDDRYRSLSKVQLTSVKADAEVRRAGAWHAVRFAAQRQHLPGGVAGWLHRNDGDHGSDLVAGRGAGEELAGHCG